MKFRRRTLMNFWIVIIQDIIIIRTILKMTIFRIKYLYNLNL